MSHANVSLASGPVLFLFFFFSMWTIFKVFKEFVTVNYKLALPESTSQWLNNKCVCQMPLWRLNSVRLQLLSVTAEGVQGGVSTLCSRESGGTDLSVQFNSVTRSRPTLCDPMDCSMPGLPVHHQLPVLAQIHVHQFSDAIQPSHPLSSPSLPTFNLSQQQDLFQWVSSSYHMAKVLEFQLQHQSFQWIFRTDFL